MSPPSLQWWVVNGWNFSVWWTLYLDFIQRETSLVTTATAITSPMNTLSHWLARSYHGRCHLLDRRANHELIRSCTEVLPEAAIWGSVSCPRTPAQVDCSTGGLGRRPVDRSRPSAIIIVQLSFGGKLCCQNSAPCGEETNKVYSGAAFVAVSRKTEKRQRGGREAGTSFTSGLSGQFPASPLSTSCLSVTVWLGWGMTLGPHTYTWGPICRVSCASCRTHSAPGGVRVIHHTGRAEHSSLTGHQRSALLCSFSNGFKH